MLQAVLANTFQDPKHWVQCQTAIPFWTHASTEGEEHPGVGNRAKASKNTSSTALQTPQLFTNTPIPVSVGAKYGLLQ